MLHNISEYNLNTSLEENFNRALNLCEQDFTHDDLMHFLANGTVAERQFAALSLEKIMDEEDAGVFISNLTGCDGKIREAVASRLDEFLRGSNAKLFLPYYQDFANATIDINANISRMVIDALVMFRDNEVFCRSYAEILVSFIEEAFEEIAKIKFRDKKYVLNKQLFKIYWALEGLSLVYKEIDKEILYGILKEVLARPEYTIREKAAAILLNVADDNLFAGLIPLIKDDENFYVRRVIDKLC